MSRSPTPDELRFRALAGSSDEHLAELDARGRVVYVSPNHPPDESERGPLSLERVHPDDRDEVATQFAAAFREGLSRRFDFRVVDPDTALRWVEVTVTPFESEDGERHVLVVSRDVTRERTTELALRASRERFQLIAENAYDMIAEYDESGRACYANGRVRAVLGFDRDRLRESRSLVHPDDSGRVDEVVAEVRSGRRDSAFATYRVSRADGSWCWVDVNFSSVQREGERRMLVIARDVSERMEAQQQLRESEARYRELVERAPVGILVVQQARIAYANAAAAAICGAAGPEALCGTPVERLVGPEDAAEIASFRGASSPPEGVRPIRIRGLDGQERHVVGTGSLTTFGGAPAFQGIVRAATETVRARREQQRLELQLQEARKLESLGVLAGGIAHDFNNLLAVIGANVRFARGDGVAPEELAEALDDAETAAARAARLVHQLLAYAGRRSPEVRSVDLGELARSMSGLLESAVSGDVTLRFELGAGLPSVHADVVQVEQVLMNLVLNAAEAVGAGPGTVTVRTAASQIRTPEIRSWFGGDDLVGGLYVCLEVEDDGEGMEPRTQARIFDPFFTTKSEGHGLGLSAALGLVRGHRGAIQLSSAPGTGTRFRIALPADAAVARHAGPSSRAALVLVADADPRVRHFAAAVLEDADVEVLQAGRGDEVLDRVARHGDELDAVLLDVELPGGGELAARLRDRWPALPLLLTGPAPGPGGSAERLVKPYTDHELRRRLEKLLAKP